MGKIMRDFSSILNDDTLEEVFLSDDFGQKERGNINFVSSLVDALTELADGSTNFAYDRMTQSAMNKAVCGASALNKYIMSTRSLGKMKKEITKKVAMAAEMEMNKDSMSLFMEFQHQLQLGLNLETVKIALDGKK